MKRNFANFMTVFGYLMSVLYVAMGLFLLLPNKLKVPVNIQIAVGLFFIPYGVFRFVKIYNKNKENTEDESLE